MFISSKTATLCTIIVSKRRMLYKIRILAKNYLNKEMNIKPLVVTVLFLVSSIAMYAQKTTSFPKGWSLGINFGTTQFDGDIRQYHHFPATQKSGPDSDDANFSELRLAGSFSLTKKINSLYSLSGEFIFGNFAGLRRGAQYYGIPPHDPYKLYKGGGDRFITRFKELDLLVNVNLSKGLIGDVLRLNSCKKWEFNAKAGFGINFSRTLRTNLQDGSYIYSIGYELESVTGGANGKSPLSDHLKETVYVYGIKAVYDFSPKLDVLIDYTVRNGQTDMWDASVMNTDHGSDRFNFLSLGVAYKFGKHDYNKEDASPLDRLRRDAAKALVKIDRLMDDSDKDGVADAFDKSPNTPLDVAVDGSGRAIDIDMDNVPDYRDADPFSSMGAQVDAKGIGLDDDKDGVPNSKDLESNTPVGVMVNQFGINVQNTNHDIAGSMVYFPSVYFASGSVIVGSSNKYRVATIAAMLKNNPDIRLNVIGHTDKVGTLKFNEKLGLQRANAVIDYLVLNYHIEANRLTPITKGEKNPLSSHGVESRTGEYNLGEINRRVNFQIAD